MNPLKKHTQDWLPEIDFGLMTHGFAPHGRDYVLIVAVGGATGGATYELTLTHVVSLHYETTVGDDVWPRSWDDAFTDYEAWIEAGEPDGYVWGTNWSLAYPGLTAHDDDPEAVEWSRRLSRPMYRATIETDRLRLSVIFHDAHVREIADDAPSVRQMLIPL